MSWVERTLRAPQSKIVTYLSPASQNEMIEVIGKKIILKDIVEEIKKSGFNRVLADEVTCSNDKILSLCFHYVDENILKYLYSRKYYLLW